jgi:triacylglycerol esterase/lipase EstA (alpha/beta hydrolase family)
VLLLHLLAVLLGLFFLGCLLFVVFTYSVAFGLAAFVSPALLRAAFVELIAELLLLPFYPFWLLAGGVYPVELAGEQPPGGGGRPVILLHGIMMNRTNWLLFGRRLTARGVGPLYGLSYFSLQAVQSSAERLRDFVEEVCLREDVEQVDIVAHSLGGVVARYYIERMDGQARIGQLVTIATPHNGTRLAHFGGGPAARELRASSTLLTDLGPPSDEARYRSIWSRGDAVVIPAASSAIGGGRDLVLEDVGHLSLLMSRRVIDAVARWLAQRSSDSNVR